jgi:hypothetical protein
VIAINTAPRFVETELRVESAPGNLELPFEHRTIETTGQGQWRERFAPYGVHVYTWGKSPAITLAGEN